ncbi:hypothetical protein GCM10023169_14470 [Georgenia halophila]|uniref:Polysaccharide pyruvyl transferase domain-containing protein n=1 Tax=Georgenia halophila TaxID=620889 RepID=A0ABP8L2L1_9MICO
MNDSRVDVGALYDSISPNTGDSAIGIAVSQELARHGIAPTRVVAPFDDDPGEPGLCIVGGGELIRPSGDPYYDRFRPRGPHVLNSVGVWDTADDLDHLRDYRLVSARSSREVDILRASVPEAELVPCTTTTLVSEPYRIPGLPDDGEPVVGIHVVPHTMEQVPEIVEAVNAIEHRKVFIPFTHYNHDDSFMAALPFDRSNAIDLPRLTPPELHSVIGQMTYVLVSSLHATIFAFAQGVPFATVDQLKVVNYLRDRDLADMVFSDTHSLTEVLHRVQEDPPDMAAAVARDKEAVHTWFGRVASLVSPPADRAPVEPEIVQPGRAPSVETLDLIARQREQVILGRDGVLASASRRSSRLFAKTAELDEMIESGRRAVAAERSRSDAMERDLAETRDELARIRDQLARTFDARLRSRAAGLRGRARTDRGGRG